MNIYQKIVEIRKTIDVFVKDTKGYNFDYVSGSQVLGKIKAKMDELGVVLEQHLTNQNHEIFNYKDKYGKDKTDFIVTGAMKMIWINADNPEDKALVDWQMLGQQDEVSKALGSGLTYSERYFLLKYFGVPTDKDDPDAKQQKATELNKNINTNIITKDQINRLFTIAKGNETIAKQTVETFGYKSSKDIKKSDYEKICNEIQNKIKERATV